MMIADNPAGIRTGYLSNKTCHHPAQFILKLFGNVVSTAEFILQQIRNARMLYDVSEIRVNSLVLFNYSLDFMVIYSFHKSH
jgi:hypothetical protein